MAHPEPRRRGPRLGALRLGVLLLAALGASPETQAAPEPLLGPDGLLWLGPVTPDMPEALRRGRELVRVDPRTGRLHLEIVDLSISGHPGPLEVRRVHDDAGWRYTLDQRLELSETGLRWVRLQETLELPADQRPMAERDEGLRWARGATFGGGVVTREEDGFVARDAQGEAWFDVDGQLLRYRDAGGPLVTVERQPEGITGLRTEDGRALRVLRDGAGRWSTLTGPGGEELYYHRYDGELLAVSGSSRPRTRYLTDAQGRIESVLWPDGSRARITRDNQGRVSAIAGPGTALLRFDWQAAGLRFTDGAGKTRTIRFDDGLIEVLDGAGRKTTTLWGPQGLSGWTDPRGLETRLQRDTEGRLTAVDGPGSLDWRVAWSGAGLSALTDPAGGTWRVERDPQGRPVRLSDPDGFTWSLSWSTQGALRAVTRGQGSPTRFERDPQGRIVAIIHPGGATTRLRRDAQGRVIAVADPAGNEILLTAWRGALPGALLTRSGARWSFGVDSMGRLKRLETPYEQVLRVDRDGAGHITRLGQPGGPHTRLSWRPDGLLNRLVDSRGGTWGAAYDAAGRPVRVLRPDGSALELGWDPWGELISLALGERREEITRDNRGAPLSLGPFRWTWDLLGRLVELGADALELQLQRTGAGRVNEVRVEGLAPIEVLRDGAGRVSGVRQGKANWTLQRDPGGLLTGAVDPEGHALRVERDERGLSLIISDGGAERRVLRDASGLPLKWVAPDGRALSADRGLLGEPLLVRFPDGSLTRSSRSFDLGQVEGQLGGHSWERLYEDAGGRAVLDQRASLGPDGRVDVLVEDFAAWTWHRDAFGRPTTLEGDEGAWTHTPGSFAGPDGSLVSTDTADRPVEAIPPVGPLAWAVGQDTLQYALDALGRVESLLGEGGRVQLEHDPLGHLTAVEGPEASWAIAWDPFGRPRALTDPEGHTTTLSWGLDRLLSWQTEGARTDLLQEPAWGWALLSDAPPLALHADPQGSPRLLSAGEEGAQVLRWSPAGYPLQDTPLTLAWRGLWSLFPGGPLLDGAGGWDPVSGRHTAPRWCPPAAPGQPTCPQGPTPIPQLDGATSPPWAPGPWLPDSPFADPLSLLIALGELEAPLGADWTALGAEPPPLPWLPQDAATPPPLLAPYIDGLPEALDPLTRAAVLAGLRGGGPVDEQALLQALLEAELVDQPALDWWTDPLPLGGLSLRWEPGRSSPQHDEFY
ncbi:MAG: hypothetical protein H6741_18600 [Alphaproteobacteria bacterium]|nr:hypothetical protein [Alphaproteobacteria bacterium]